MKLHGTMPIYRDLFPHYGAVGEKFVIKKISKLYLRDCLLILSKLSRHHMKYCQMSFGDGGAMYRQRCLELLGQKTTARLLANERKTGSEHDVIFPELSVAHLIKLCFLNCNKTDYTKGEFSRETLETIGDCLLVTNAIMADHQTQFKAPQDIDINDYIVGCTRQLIADENFHQLEKFYQNYFLFSNLLQYKKTFDIEKAFLEKYHVTIFEYFAFLFLVHSQFVITDGPNEDWEMPHLDLKSALSNIKDIFKIHLIENFLFNKIKRKNISKSFYDVTDFVKKPLVLLDDGKIIPLSLRRLIIGLTDAVYFDILDSLNDEKEQEIFSTAYGYAVEDYMFDLVLNIDKSAIREFTYLSGKNEIKTVDVISVQKSELIFFECKKRQFHTMEFLRRGTRELYDQRLVEFCRIPLEKICKKIADFRAGKYDIPGASRDMMIYPVIVSPIAPPLLSGAWDKLELDKIIVPEEYQADDHIAPPEFIDFSELEHIEEYLRQHPEFSFIDLISLKRADPVYHNANWMTILHKNGMALTNKRLSEKYRAAMQGFRELLFD